MAKVNAGPQHYPVYDPAQDYDPNEPLYAERMCACGGILRIRARAGQMRLIVHTWETRHSTRRCEPTDRKGAWAAREARRQKQAKRRGETFKPSKPPATFKVEE